MRKFIYCIMFGLLLAMGWTNDAQAQRLPAESLAKRLVAPANMPRTGWDNAGPCYHNHSYSVALAKKSATDFKVTTEGRPGSKTNAPLRAGEDREMKSISYDDAYAITYTWNCNGRDSTSHATDVAKDPEQMYELLREVYTNKNFPGPTYSAYTKDDVPERKVYYGAVEGGWNITGDVLPSTSTTETITTYGSITVADGNSTSSGYQYLPLYGYYFNSTQRTQMIYTASQLGLQAGDKITSLTFYPRTDLTFSGGSITLSLANTTTSSFSGNNALTTSMTQVATVTSYTVNNGEWTINFDQPFTYTGNNILVQVTNTAGNRGNTSFYGVQLGYNVYQGLYNYNGTNQRTRFLPKAKFDVERTITFNPYNTIGDIKITASSNDVFFRSITVYDENNNVLTSWDNSETPYSMQVGGNTYVYYNLPMWDLEGVGYMLQYSYTYQGTTYNFGYLTCGTEPGTFYIPYYLTAGHSSVRLVINAMNAGDGTPTVTVNDGTPRNIDYQYLEGQDYSWTINAKSYPHTEYDPDYYLPNQEGYTALVVAVKNEATGYYDNYDYAFGNGYFDTKAEIVNYLATHVDSIKLLTDGMRLGQASDYTIGTMFNAEGTYNKFFFLGKGQARQKADILRYREVYNNHLRGEEIPFRFMFEQFSPTTGALGSQTDNFYSKLMEGNVYNVIHDCRSVMQFNHQFSMSGNEGTTPYAMTGMNFFIPDYRLKYWEDEIAEGYYYDGRIANPYQIVSDDGNPAYNPSLIFQNPSNAAAWYAQYNQLYPPKVGIYKITLEAVAEPRTDIALTQEPGNKNYMVTLHWVSSLNEMTGHEVPQTYTVYYWDPVDGQRKYLVVEGYTTVNGETGETTLVYYVEQFSYSYTIDYIIYGSPDDADHDQFVAVSNIDGVVIPGWDDFVGLELDHHESDFVVGDMANYYRNFLTVVNEDIYNGLTVSKISGYNPDDPTTPLPQMRQFNLYRWAIKDGVAQPEEKVATITFDQIQEDQVHYTITYEDNQDILASKYERAAMDIPDEGWIRVKGNGDLVIWPNGYFVNLKSIIIKNGNDVLYEWHSSSANVDTDNPNLPSGWETSPGSKMMPYIVTSSGEKVCYMEGGGYIYIPNMLNNPAYTNLTVEIVAYTDGGHVGRIEVNDKSQTVNNVAATYTWGTTENPISPAAAPRHDEKDNPSKTVKDVNSKASINN